MNVKDQLQRKIEFRSRPIRIISLVPSLTELIVDIGLENHLVGVTKFCVHPKDIRQNKTVVGGTKSVNIDKIKSLYPDIVLCNKEENTKEMIEQLEGIAPVHVSDINSLEDMFELIAMYAQIFSVKKESDELIDKILKEKEIFNKWQEERNQNKKVAYFIWRNPLMVVASNTFIDNMIKEAGFKNVFSGSNRYPEIELNNAALANANEIFLSSEPFPFKVKHIKEFKNIFPEKKITLVDGEMFSWYGSRLVQAFRYFKTLHQ